MNKKNEGFSLVEILIVAAIIATLSVVLILNFRSSPKGKTGRDQAVAVIVSDFRGAQSKALAASLYQGVTVCGYGIHYVDSTTYLIYAGVLDNGALTCQASNHNYQAGIDSIVETKKVINSNMVMAASFNDVFFEPPDPKTYINNNSALNVAPVAITIRLNGQANCVSGPCTVINVYTSGRIDIN